MAVYPLNPMKKGAFTLYPQQSYLSENQAAKSCEWYLTDYVSRDNEGRPCVNYRLHSLHPRTFAEFMAYDVICPKCSQRMHPVALALDLHDLALYGCRNCNERLGGNLR